MGQCLHHRNVYLSILPAERSLIVLNYLVGTYEAHHPPYSSRNLHFSRIYTLKTDHYRRKFCIAELMFELHHSSRSFHIQCSHTYQSKIRQISSQFNSSHAVSWLQEALSFGEESQSQRYLYYICKGYLLHRG